MKNINISYPSRARKRASAVLLNPVSASLTVAALILQLMWSFQTWAAPLKTEQWLTSKGTQVTFYEAHEVPMVDVSIAFKAGSAYDGQFYGLSALTTNMLNQGNGTLAATAVAQKLEETGAQFNSDTNKDMSIITLRSLSEINSLTNAFNIFTLIVNQPKFPESEFLQEKNQQLIAIKQQQESPDTVADMNFFQTLYADHPYGHPVLGDKSHVEAITLQQVKDFYQNYFVAKNSVLVLVGDIDSQTAHKLAEQLTGGLSTGVSAPALPVPKTLSQSQNLSILFPASQTAVRLGQIGIDHHNPEYFPLLVGNYILGGSGLVSILGTELRENRGLTYGVYSQFSPMLSPGPFIINFSTQNTQANAAIKLTHDTLAQFLKQGPSAEQLIAAKQNLIGGFPLSLAGNRNIADILLRIAFYQLPANYLNTYIDHVKEVDAKQIQHAFQSTINIDKLLQVEVGPKG